MAMGSSKEDMPLAEINVTPLVDVMLVLLIIFMVTAPMMDQGLPLDLPKSKGSALDNTAEKQMVLKILKDRTVHLNQDPIRVNDVKEKLVNVMKARRDKTLFVRADRDVPYGFVAYVIGEVRAAGISKLGLVTQPLDGGSPNEHR